MYPTLAALLKYAVPGRMFVDIGAHHGMFSAAFAEAGMKVFAVEPNAGNVEQFNLNVKNVPVMQVALSDTDGTALLHHCGPSTLHTLDKQRAQELFPAEQHLPLNPPETVRTLRWGTFCKEAGITEVDIVKEDAKFENVKVLTAMFEDGPLPRVLCTEIRPDNADAVFSLCRNARMDVADSISLDGARKIYDTIFVKQPSAEEMKFLYATCQYTDSIGEQ